MLVIVALLFDLGRPYRVWHPLVMWNPHSVMFEVGWCVTLYTTVLALEFSPVVLERLRLAEAAAAGCARLLIPLVILGVLLSTLHQSSLGSLYLIVPHKLHPLWYTPLLPVFFFVSALDGGPGDDDLRVLALEQGFRTAIWNCRCLQGLARVLAVLLAAYLAMRFLDLVRRGALPLLLQRGHGKLPVRARDLPAAAAHAAAVPEPRPRQPAAIYWLRGAGDLRLHRQPAERQRDGHGGGLRRPLRAKVD